MATVRKEETSKHNRHNRGAVCNCLLTCLLMLRRIYDAVVDFIFGQLYSAVPVKIVPSVKSNLLTESAVTIAEKIRKKEITSRQVVESFIERIKEINPILNAMVDENFARALEEADKVDEFISSGKYTTAELESYKPLLGVPFTSKESVAAEGMSFTLGMVNRKDIKAEFDAKILKGLKDSGAILLGVTNIPEYNLWVESRNNVYGQTSNPYDINRGVGGSSGGEACIVSACGSPIGIGTDIGGSSRIPAFCCGVYGHKMTAGLINTYGISFRTGDENRTTIVTAGPICRYARDIKPVIKAMLSETPESLSLLNLDLPVNTKKLRYFYVEEPGDSRVSPISTETKTALLKLVGLFKDAGQFENAPEQVDFAGFKYSFTLWRYWMSKESENFAYDITNKKSRATVWIEFPKKLLGLSDYTLAAIMKLADMQFPLPPAQWAEEETKKLRSEISEKLKDDGVLLFPSYPSVPPYHYLPFFRPYNFAYWAIFNALRLPVTQVPIGLNKDGIPLGIQVVAGQNQDRLCAAVAEEIEILTGGWVPPFPTSAPQ